MIEEKYAGPIYLTKWYRFFPDIGSAVDFVYDEVGADLSSVEAHPCSVGQAHTPDIRKFVEEAWGEQYEDFVVAGDLSTEAAELCDRLQKLLAAEAPTMWEPLRERIQLPDVKRGDGSALAEDLEIQGYLK